MFYCPFDRASFYYAHCTSTLDKILPYATQAKLAEGTVFIADFQTKGRGQAGSSWESEAGKNLLFTLVLYPIALMASDVFSLNIMVSLALHEVATDWIAQKQAQVAIKWPNDVYCGAKKLAGILIYTQIGNKGRVKVVWISVGFNVNQLHFKCPYATSLALHNPNTLLDRSLIFNQILHKLGSYYAQLQNHRMDLLWTSYLNKLYRRSGWHDFQTVDGYTKGRIVTVNAFGQLVIERSNGQLHHYRPKEIIFV